MPKKKNEIVEYVKKRHLGFVPETLQVMQEVSPKYLKIVKMIDDTLFSEGALPAKTKRLIAIAVVAATQCVDCVDAQVRAAINQGATLEEIVEAVGVAIATAGVPALSASKRALRMAKAQLKK